MDAPPRIVPPARDTRSNGAPLLSGRLERVKSGPVAAAVAVALVLGATALPAGVPKGAAPFNAGVGSGAPRATSTVGGLDELPGLAPVDLGPSLGEFVLTDTVRWTDRFDGTSALSVLLRSCDDPGATLEGKLVLRGAESIARLERDVVVAVSDPLPGFASLRTALPSELQADAIGYVSLAGRLSGGGSLAGVQLDVRNAPGGVVRRGPWRLDDTSEATETVFARLLWLLDPDVRSGGAAANLPDHGLGTLALRLVPAVL